MALFGALKNVFGGGKNDDEKYRNYDVKRYLENGKWGYKDRRTGVIVIEPKYDYASPMYNGLSYAYLSSESITNIINSHGQVINKKGNDFVDSTYDIFNRKDLDNATKKAYAKSVLERWISNKPNHFSSEDEAILKFIKKEAKNEDFEALGMYAYCTEKGIGEKPEIANAMLMYRRAAHQNDSFSLNCLGDCHYYANGIPRNYKEALDRYRKAAYAGNALGQRNFANFFVNEFDGGIYDYYLPLAQDGDAESQYRLGMLLYYGKDCVSNIKSAVEWLEKSATQGFAYAQLALGRIYLKGKGIPQDLKLAKEYIDKAATARIIDAWNALADYYANDSNPDKDLKRSYEYELRAALAGDFKACYNVAIDSREGFGETNDEKEVDFWFKKGIELTTSIAKHGNPEAQYMLGLYYLNGFGTKQDNKKATELFESAAQKGHINAKLMIAAIYNDESATEEKGIAIYKELAELNVLEAMYELGKYYSDKANDDDFDIELLQKGNDLLKKASNADYADAKFELTFNELVYKVSSGKKYTKEDVNVVVKIAENGSDEMKYRVGSLLFADLEDEYEDLGLSLIKKAANEGHIDAKFYIADIYDDNEEYDKAFPIYQELAKQDYTLGYAKLGIYYYNGYYVEKDKTKAVKYLKECEGITLEEDEESVRAQAMDLLGDCYYYGEGIEKNLKRSFECYLNAAEAGNVSAQNDVGYAYENGEGVDKDLSKAAQWYQKAANNGNKFAMRNIANFYKKGVGVAKDYNLAFKWFKLAAENGNIIANNDLGLCYLDGYGTEKNETEAIKYFTTCAAKGNMYAQYNLGKCYLNGTGVKQDKTKAKELLEKAANQGHEESKKLLFEFGGMSEHVQELLKKANGGDSNAQYDLGSCYWNGNGVATNLNEAFYWYKKSAENGNYNGENALGNCYNWGKGVEQNYTLAMDWYLKAAKKNHHYAQYSLGEMYEKGHGVKIDLETALGWYQAAAQNKNPNAADKVEKLKTPAEHYAEAIKGNAEQQNYLGVCYHDGLGVEQNYKLAAEWYLQAIKQNNKHAYNNIGLLYKYGNGVPKDLAKACEYFKTSAKLGKIEAMVNYALCCYEGTGTEKNYTEALNWFHKAADNNHSGACCYIGNCYDSGKGVEQDYKKSCEWYQKGININGNSWCYYNLATNYLNGNGVPQNRAKAIELYKASAEKGNESAKEKLSKLGA